MQIRVDKPSAFTLIELMIVLILIGIFSGLMIGEMRGTFEDALLRSTARKIIGAANLAGSQAVTANKAHTLWIRSGENALKVLSAGDNKSLEDEALDARVRILIREGNPLVDSEVEEAPGQQAREDLERIDFLPDGTADSREIVLRDRLGVELVLRINPVTGRIRIVEGEAKP